DIDRVRDVVVAVWIENEIHGLEQSDSVARGGRGAANLHGVEFDAGSNAFGSADDVRDMRAVPVEINRVGVRRQIAVGPDLTHKIKASNDLCRGKQSVGRRVLRVARVGPVSRFISIHGSGAAKLLVSVMDR